MVCLGFLPRSLGSACCDTGRAILAQASVLSPVQPQLHSQLKCKGQSERKMFSWVWRWLF